MVLTRSGKEELVKQLYEEGKTVREIAKEVHMSFGPIGNIIRKTTGDYNKDNNDEVKKSKETEALKLFQEGKTPVEAAIILNISSDETEGLYLGLYLGYLRLKNSCFDIQRVKISTSIFHKIVQISKKCRNKRRGCSRSN